MSDFAEALQAAIEEKVTELVPDAVKEECDSYLENHLSDELESCLKETLGDAIDSAVNDHDFTDLQLSTDNVEDFESEVEEIASTVLDDNFDEKFNDKFTDAIKEWSYSPEFREAVDRAAKELFDSWISKIPTARAE